VLVLHLCVTVRDLDRSLAFYRALGLELRRQTVSTTNIPSYYVAASGSELPELQLMATASSFAASSMHHLALMVDDINATLATVADTFGIAPERGPYHTPDESLLVAWLRDPDGNAIELIEAASVTVFLHYRNPPVAAPDGRRE
jgi:lactoylglutathione lyase